MAGLSTDSVRYESVYGHGLRIIAVGQVLGVLAATVSNDGKWHLAEEEGTHSSVTEANIEVTAEEIIALLEVLVEAGYANYSLRPRILGLLSRFDDHMMQAIAKLSECTYEPPSGCAQRDGYRPEELERVAIWRLRSVAAILDRLASPSSAFENELRRLIEASRNAGNQRELIEMLDQPPA